MRISDWSSDVCSSVLAVAPCGPPGSRFPGVDLILRTEELDGWAGVKVIGDVDVASAPRLRTHVVSVVAGGQPNVVIDLEGVDFLDSTGLGVVIGALKRTRSQGGDLRLVCTRSAVQRLFELTRSEEHTSELQSLMRISYAVSCLKRKKNQL